MIDILIVITSCLFIFIGILHVYWGFGGSCGINAALPTKDDSISPVLRPGVLGTLFVGLLCFFASVLLLVQTEVFTAIKSSLLTEWLCIAGGVVFFLRAIGEGRYVGFFKNIKHTKFAKLDTAFYSPLCVWISLIFVVASFT
ncbi:DUF3995 domain-containing protein [Paenibacillus sp. PK3_47]|uniref:DUF3995 domain-containing protein n=1 Tax=Paenibacillus sp. PK3_47 TaxID=2072642 RepID=UPI00201E39A9|nr:DUF3995 domain-containing protein [Paenibacillus sp. PK3_47]UQZ34144.1 DUF3995 domain-containing protein [Paenibacillus sp. PK3_47]